MRATPILGALLAILPSPAGAHGGVYRGPGSGVPAGGAPAATGAPATAASGGASTDWRTWWSFNRDAFLDLKAAIHATRPATGLAEPFGSPEGRAAQPTSSRPAAEDIDRRVVPALVHALAEQRSDDLRSGALLALAKIGRHPAGSRLEQVFAPLLEDPSQEIAETAAVALGVLADPGSASLLAELCGGTAQGRQLVDRTEVPYRTRAFAAYGLGLIGSMAPNEDVRRYVVHHLVRELEREKDAPTRDVHVACVLSLGLVRLAPRGTLPSESQDGPLPPTASREAQIDYLLAVLGERGRHDLVRAHVPVALARLAQGTSPATLARVVRAVGPWIEPESGADPALQQGAANALALLGDNDQDEIDCWIRALLERAATSGERVVRDLAVLALARVAAREGEGPDPASGLDTVRTFLLHRLTRGATLERPWAALALGVLERTRQDARLSLSTDVAPTLREALAARESPLELGAYLLAAGLARDLQAHEALLAHALDPRDDETRGYACVALGLMGAHQAIEPLREIVRASRYRPGLLGDAAVGLGLMGDREVVPLLIEMLAASESLAATAAITSALGFIGDARTIEPLVQLLEDPETNDRARAFAAVALGIVCDKESLPWNAKLAADVTFWIPPATLFDGGKGILDLL